MQTSSEIERNDFDQWISWTLATGFRNVHPSDKVWQRIVHCIENLDETGQETVQGAARQAKSVDKLFILLSYIGIEPYIAFVYTGLAFTYGV